MEAVGGDGGRVDDPLRLRRDRGVEDVATALEVDLTGLLGVADQDEGEVHDHVGALYQRVDRIAVEHVALLVGDLA